MSLLDRIREERSSSRAVEKRYSADQWYMDYLRPAMTQFNFGGSSYTAGLGRVNTTYVDRKAAEISATLPGYSAALRECPPAFAAQMVRALILSQARFTWRSLPGSGSPRKLFGTRELAVLEHPWPLASTGDMLCRLEWHAGLAGNAYVLRQRDRLRVLRPDWVAILYGSDQDPEYAGHALDGELIGFVYQPGGFASGSRPVTLLPKDVAHWAPLPDPEMAGVGMSWITPAVREIQSDRAATEHKVQYFLSGATPNLVVKGIPAMTKEQFDEIADAMEARHAGVENAYRTLYLTAGADVSVVGSDLSQIDFKNVQGASETRISVLSRVPASLLGISEGLAGSSLNAGNFGMARRMFADTWVFPSLQSLAGALADILTVPKDAELWFDTLDIPLLREDAKDAAEIVNMQITGITTAVREGFTADSAVAAVQSQDITLLKHTGMTSVQLQTPGATEPEGPAYADEEE